MTAGLIGTLITVALTVVGWWIKWRLGSARKDRLRREQAELEAHALRLGLKGNYAANKAHEKRILEILGGVDDTRASELLSQSPKGRLSGAGTTGAKKS